MIVSTLQLSNKNRTTDKEIILIALKEERVVIAKDSNFLESFILRNKPSKLVLNKTGEMIVHK